MAIDSASSAFLAPGFRFHPTDEELVRYYLRRKVCGKPLRFDAIADVDVYKVEPWDLPGRSRLKTRDLEWYFFSVLDKKYGNGSKTNRATDKGYWKTTGKDRAVYHRTRMVGMKKTLVYHSGRAPKGERTNWVMHEYRLIDEELEKAGFVQDVFVLCRIFRKSGSGPKNGEQYGAPFIEEEWENDDLAVFPKEEIAVELPVDENICLDENDLDQIFGADMPVEGGPLPLNFDANSAVVPTDLVSDGEEFLANMGQNQPELLADIGQNQPEFLAEIGQNQPEFLADMGQNQPGLDETNKPKLFDLPVQYEVNATVVKREYIGETSSQSTSVDMGYWLDQPIFMDASEYPSPDDGSFLEANDLKNGLETDPGSDMLDEYLTYFDATADNLPCAFDAFDSSIASENLITDSALAQEYVDEGAQKMATQNNTFVGESSNDATASSKQESLFTSDYKYPFFNHMLGNIPAPPAFASEFPSKKAALHLASASQSQPINVTAGMVRFRNITLTGNGLDMSLGKQGQVNIVLSFDLGDSQPTDKANSAANSSTLSRSWLESIFFCVLILSMSFKLRKLFLFQGVYELKG